MYTYTYCQNRPQKELETPETQLYPLFPNGSETTIVKLCIV
jgi:hypothetical protein